MTATATAAKPNPFALMRQEVKNILLSEDAKSHIAPLLSPGTSLAMVVSTINQVVAENPEILECTPASIILAVGKGVRQGLEFGETAHLVPFNVKVSKKGEKDRWEKRAKMLRDWKGDIELVKASGSARDLDAQCFYEKEHFVYHQGTAPYIEHHPMVDEKARGPMLGAYAWALISQRQPLKIVVMSASEIDEIRQAKSKSWKEGPLPAWYACKTMIHQISKRLPKNRQLAPVLKQFDDEEIQDGEFEVVDETTVAAGANQPAADAPVTPAAEGGAVTPAPAATPAEPAASEQTSDREAIASAAPTGGQLATKDQIYDILDMLEHEAVPEHIREKIKARIKTGLPANLASTWKQMIEEQIAAWHAGNKLDFATAATA